ncbi:uncharacterized protein UHOD_11920 [Ustilago sp. UG-2017b]|nr:uncharacterized protein UHOD_11920 [Ustilago sp. UG-2017b]
MLCRGRLHHVLCTYHALLLILNSICLPLTLLVPTLARVGAESLNNIVDYFLREGWAKEFSNHVWTIILACKYVVRGLAPETQVGLSRYSVTIKLCDSYCLGIGLDELRRSATIKLRDDSGWRSLDILSGGSARSISILIPGPQWTTAFGSIYIRTADLLWVAFGHQVVVIQHTHYKEEQPLYGESVEWMRIHSTSDDEKSTFFIEYCAGGPSSATPVLLSCVASFDTAPPPQDLLAGLLYTAPPPSTGNGSSGSYLPSP